MVRGNDRSHPPPTSSKPRKHKYNAHAVYLVGPVVCSDLEQAKAIAKGSDVKIVRFASQAEYLRDRDLYALQASDKIHALERQPKFDLYVGGKKICRYIGDWRYRDGPAREHNAQLVVEDRKGHITPAFKIKWALAKALHPEIEWRLS